MKALNALAHFRKAFSFSSSANNLFYDRTYTTIVGKIIKIKINLKFRNRIHIFMENF